MTAATVDQISDFGKVTVAATGAEVTAMNSVANFQAAATARGGDNTDIIDFQALTSTAVAADTFAKWVAVANVAAATNGETAAFQFNGNTYIFQQQASGDELVELTGVTGVTGVVLIGGAVAAGVGDIFVF